MLPGAEEVVLPRAAAPSTPERAAGAHLRLHPGGPLVLGVHDHVDGAVRLPHPEDVDVGDEGEQAQEALRVAQPLEVVAVALLEEELRPDHLLAGRDVKGVGEPVGPVEALVEVGVGEVEDGVVVDEDRGDAPLRARLRRRPARPRGAERGSRGARTLRAAVGAAGRAGRVVSSSRGMGRSFPAPGRRRSAPRAGSKRVEEWRKRLQSPVPGRAASSETAAPRPPEPTGRPRRRSSAPGPDAERGTPGGMPLLAVLLPLPPGGGWPRRRGGRSGDGAQDPLRPRLLVRDAEGTIDGERVLQVRLRLLALARSRCGAGRSRGASRPPAGGSRGRGRSPAPSRRRRARPDGPHRPREISEPAVHVADAVGGAGGERVAPRPRAPSSSASASLPCLRRHSASAIAVVARTAGETSSERPRPYAWRASASGRARRGRAPGCRSRSPGPWESRSGPLAWARANHWLGLVEAREVGEDHREVVEELRTLQPQRRRRAGASAAERGAVAASVSAHRPCISSTLPKPVSAITSPGRSPAVRASSALRR